MRWILRGIVDSRLAEPLDQIGGERQQAAGLIHIRNQVDDNMHTLPEGLGVVRVGLEQRKGIGVVGGILE